MSATRDETSKTPLSVAIVCKNAEQTIERAVRSVSSLASEIIALDSGSTDRTMEILRDHGARVEEIEWQGYIRTKQMAFDRCAEPWILNLDADESIDETMQASIRRVVEADDPAFDGYEVNRKMWYLGSYLEHAWQPERRLRLVRRGRARFAGLDPHDHLEVLPDEQGRVGRVGRLEGTMRHDAFESIGEFLARQVSHSVAGATNLASTGERGSYYRLLTSPPMAFAKQMILKQAWRDGPRGWVAAGSTAAATLMKHMILLEKTRCPDRTRR